jgi:hypothetical protein
VRIDVTRSGGFGGMVMRASVDTADLPPEDAARIEQSLRGIDFVELGRTRSPSTGTVDRFQYDLTITADDQRHEVSTGETQLPSEVRQVLDELLRRRM